MKLKISNLRGNGILILIIFLLIIVLSILSPDRFLTKQNFISMAYQLPEFGLYSIAMTIVIFTAGINLSMIFVSTFTMIVGGLAISKLAQTALSPLTGILIGILIVLVLGMAIGALNGYIIAYLGVPSILTTLGTMILFEGLSLFITKGGAISGFPEQFDFIGNKSLLLIPFPLLVFIVVALIMYILMEKTTFGQQIYAIGSNQKVARFSGISVSKNLLIIYIISAVLASIAAIIMASRYNSIKESYGISYLLQSITVAVLGGANINGGEGTIIGTILAVILIQILSNGFNILGINRYLTVAFIGLVLILAVIINSSKKK